MFSGCQSAEKSPKKTSWANTSRPSAGAPALQRSPPPNARCGRDYRQSHRSGRRPQLVWFDKESTKTHFPIEGIPAHAKASVERLLQLPVLTNRRGIHPSAPARF